ncbi:MAG: hypothetical protein ACLTR6_09925 [Clostridium fessum]
MDKNDQWYEDLHTSKQLVAALKEAGFTEIKTYSNAKNHWISIVATK